jgi:hypothetical protein
VSFAEEEWSLPVRFVARRPSPSSPGWEVLVKWQGQVRVITSACKNACRLCSVLHDEFWVLVLVL